MSSDRHRGNSKTAESETAETAGSETAGRRHTLRKLDRAAEADPDALNVTLFRRDDGAIGGWFIGPFSVVGGRATLPHLPQSDETNAAVAVVRAIKVAEEVGCQLCVIDPDDLWDEVWRR